MPSLRLVIMPSQQAQDMPTIPRKAGTGDGSSGSDGDDTSPSATAGKLYVSEKSSLTTARYHGGDGGDEASDVDGSSSSASAGKSSGGGGSANVNGGDEDGGHGGGSGSGDGSVMCARTRGRANEIAKKQTKRKRKQDDSSNNDSLHDDKVTSEARTRSIASKSVTKKTKSKTVAKENAVGSDSRSKRPAKASTNGRDKESEDPSVSYVRKQVHCEICQDEIHHSDIKVVNQIPGYSQDNDEDDVNDDDNQDECNAAGNFEEVSDEHMGSDNDSYKSCDDDDLMVKANVDMICHKDNLRDSEGNSGKNRTKKSIYDSYPALSTLPVPINLPFSTKDVLCSFELNDGAEVSDDEIPLDLIKISGKKKYFLQANDFIITKLVSIGKKRNKKFQERKDFSFMALRGDQEEFVVYPKKFKMRECNIPERFNILTKYNQYNWIVPKDLSPPTAEALGLLCGSFRFFHELADGKKSEDDNNAFNSYDFRLYGLRCAVPLDVEKAKRMKLAMEGYIRAALFHGIFYIVPSDYAYVDSAKVPGTVPSTKFQFKKIDSPNWPVVPKKTASTYNRVRHRRYCFLLSINLLNGTSVLPHSFETVAYGTNKKKNRKESKNIAAINAKRINYKIVEEKVKYNMKMLHKASLSASCSARFWSFDNDGRPFNQFNLTSLYRRIVETFFQNSFSFKNSCVVGHINEVVVPGGKTVLINDFIAMFYGMYGTFVKATVSSKICKEKTAVDGKIRVRMTKSAKSFWEGPVWEEWEKSYPDLKLFLESYPRDKVVIELVETCSFGG